MRKSTKAERRVWPTSYEFRLTGQRSTFQQQVAAELLRARTKHAGEQRSAHEGYGVLLEEVDEFWDLVKSQTPKTERERKDKRTKMRAELIQIAAMAQRTAEDLGLMDD